MKSTLATLALSCLLVLAAGCSGSPASEDGSAAAEEAASETEAAPEGFAATMAKFAEQACACKDKPCAERLNATIDKFVEGQDDDAEISEEEVMQAMTSMFEAAACLAEWDV